MSSGAAEWGLSSVLCDWGLGHCLSLSSWKPAREGPTKPGNLIFLFREDVGNWVEAKADRRLAFHCLLLPTFCIMGLMLYCMFKKK